MEFSWEIAMLAKLDEIALPRRVMVNQICDPLGLLLLIEYRLLLQKLSTLPVGWDDILEEELMY